MTLQLICLSVAIAACWAIGRAAGWLVLALRPAPAVSLLAAAALTASLACGMALTAVAIAMLAGQPAVAAAFDWSAAMVTAELPVPAWLGLPAALIVVVLLGRGVVRALCVVHLLMRSDRTCRQLRAGGGPVVIVEHGVADAYAVAGLRGCVVITRNLFDRMTADERRVVTLHELSHLRRRHHFYVHLLDIAAAANPLLNPGRAAVRLAVERWADEDAAIGVGDRRLAGRALARVALLRAQLAPLSTTHQHDLGSPHAAPLGVATLQVTSRVQALLTPPPRKRSGRLAVGSLLAAAVLATGLTSLADVHAAIEAAEPCANALQLPP